MPTDFRLPELGENITEADVVRVLVREGDMIAVDQPIATIETEKATVDVPSGVAGRITQIHIAAGQTVSPGAVIVTVDAAAPAEPVAAPAPAAAVETAAPPPTPTPPPAPVPAPAVEPPPPSAATTAAPAAESTATEAVSVPASAPPPPAPPPPAPPEGTASAFAAPSVRTFAREIGVDINTVRGSGPGGRIDVEDVKRHAREMSAAPTETSGVVEPPLPDFAQYGAVERQPLSRFRRTVARNMTTSWTIPQVTLFHTADLAALEGVRRRYRDAASKAGGTLTTSALLIKLAGAALQEFPHFNASLDLERDELVLKQYVHIGLAVDTERGLAVSVIRDVDKKDILQIAADLKGISERVKAEALSIDEMRGASFTISSLETLGISHFTPLVNWPEVAILGVGRDADLPSYENEELHTRRRMALSLAFDHRVVDGADGARFLRWLVNAIHEPTILDIPGAAS